MLFKRLAEGEPELPPYCVQHRASQALLAVRSMRRAAEEQLSEINRVPARLLAQAFGAH